MFFKFVIFVAVLGIAAECREIYRRDTLPTAPATDAPKKDVKRSEDVQSSGLPDENSIASAILKAIESFKEKATQTVKPAHSKRSTDEKKEGKDKAADSKHPTDKKKEAKDKAAPIKRSTDEKKEEKKDKTAHCCG